MRKGTKLRNILHNYVCTIVEIVPIVVSDIKFKTYDVVFDDGTKRNYSEEHLVNFYSIERL